MLETAIAIGVSVTAGAELILYRKFVIEPELPEGISDLGLRGDINFELLRRISPDLVLSSPWYTRLEPNLRRIAPVLSLRIHQRGQDPYDAAVAAAREIGKRFGREAEAETLILETAATMSGAATLIAAKDLPPVFVITIGDPRHFRVFGPDSMVGAVITRLGLANAWASGTSYSVQAPVDILALAERPDAMIVVISPVPEDAMRLLPSSEIWRNLPAVMAGRVAVIEPVNHFGGLPAARRLARLLTAALLDGAGRLGSR
jgi:iron complex transport system substrate-binding protein